MHSHADMQNPTLRAVTIGTFDGLHRGHMAVIDTLRREAVSHGLTPTVMTFDRHPLHTIAPERAPHILMPLKRKLEALRNSGVDVISLEFSRKMAAIPASDWLARLHDLYGVRLVVVGYDNTFGCDGLQLSISDYQRIGKLHGVEVVSAPVLPGISSSAIRSSVAAGDMQKAMDMLGRPFSLEGNVGHGQHLGSKLGFPTANLFVDAEIQLPATGVYAADAILPDGSIRRAVVNIGFRPSVNTLPAPSVEAHILDFNGDLYGDRVQLLLLSRLRDEKHFPSLLFLQRAIAADIATARKLGN